jgi:hypothetical protein
MENSLCNFEILQNPSRKYANTVNLVFFRAVPLTKNFQKYVDGLANWRKYMKYYPDSQLQIFVDEHVMKDEKIQKLLKELNARVYLFKCPQYFIKDDFHLGLFATMIRFYPFFDVNTHPLKVAHIQELEPDPDFVPMFEKLNGLSHVNHGASIIYNRHNIYSSNFISNKYKFNDFIYYPWIIAGRFSAYDKVPFKLFTDYLEDVEKGKKFYNIYENWGALKKPEHGKYSFGVDEIFLNDYYLGYLIDNHKTIGILVKYKIAYPLYYLGYEIRHNPKTTEILQYILGKKGSLTTLIKESDTLFNASVETEELIDCSKRFYEIIEKEPNWLGKNASRVILEFFKGYLYRKCLILIKDNEVIDIKDLK